MIGSEPIRLASAAPTSDAPPVKSVAPHTITVDVGAVDPGQGTGNQPPDDDGEGMETATLTGTAMQMAMAMVMAHLPMAHPETATVQEMATATDREMATLTEMATDNPATAMVNKPMAMGKGAISS